MNKVKVYLLKSHEGATLVGRIWSEGGKVRHEPEDDLLKNIASNTAFAHGRDVGPDDADAFVAALPVAYCNPYLWCEEEK